MVCITIDTGGLRAAYLFTRSIMGFRLSDQSPDLQAAVADPTVGLVYSPTNRVYIVPDLQPQNLPRRQSFPPTKRRVCPGHTISFCPFTGAYLPGSVDEIRDNILEEEMGLGHLFPDIVFDARIGPRSMRGEQWWLKRGIGETVNKEELEEDKTQPPFHSYDPIDHRFPGYRRCQEEPPHFCYSLGFVFDDARVMYWYLPHTREYGFRIIDPEQRVDFQPIRILPAPYCPWCGTRLPSSLRTQWEERVRNRGLDPDDLVASHPPPEGWPEELTTSAWWKNEGL
ncbi:protein of unknown function [Magnetospira sp. QH-2]|nr:protein of unknown function [Magnetospira sp. QH-2]